MQHDGDAPKRAHEHHRGRSIATRANDGGDMVAAQVLICLPHAAHHGPGSRQEFLEAMWSEAFCNDALEADAMRRHQPCFQAGFIADKEQSCAVVFERLSDRQRRVDMPPGPTSG